MSTLVVGIGNTLLGDDGAGPFVVELLWAEGARGLELRAAHTLLPELAGEMPGHTAVVFVDADRKAREISFRPIAPADGSGLHRFAPAQVVEMARGLGFEGEAWICSVPVQSTEPGETLSPEAELAAVRTASLLLARLGSPS